MRLWMSLEYSTVKKAAWALSYIKEDKLLARRDIPVNSQTTGAACLLLEHSPAPDAQRSKTEIETLVRFCKTKTFSWKVDEKLIGLDVVFMK